MEYNLKNCESLYCTPETYNTVNSTIPQPKKKKTSEIFDSKLMFFPLYLFLLTSIPLPLNIRKNNSNRLAYHMVLFNRIRNMIVMNM